MQTTGAWLIHACEKVNKRAHVVPALVVAACLMVPASADAQPVGSDAPGAVAPVRDTGGQADTSGASHGEAVHGETTPADAPHGADAAHAADAADAHGGEHHEESIWATIARVANFALLAGGLFYFLRAPIAAHLASRGEQIRGDLAMASQVRADATQRLADIEQRLKELPAELELVTQRGAEEVAAEEARMAAQAEVERQRLMAQARREIDQQVRTARQSLTAHAAALSIAVAREHLRTTLTETEQHRLADEFTGQVGGVR